MRSAKQSDFLNNVLPHSMQDHWLYDMFCRNFWEFDFRQKFFTKLEGNQCQYFSSNVSIVVSLYLLGCIFNCSINSYLFAIRDKRLIFSSYEYFEFYVGYPMSISYCIIVDGMISNH